jgi:hypothetical protein
MKTKRFVRTVYTTDDCYDNHPDKAYITIHETLAKRILRFNKEVLRLKAYKMVEFNYTVKWKETGVKEPDWRVDCCTLNVSDIDFRWDCYLKDTNILLETDSISIANLRKAFPHLKG